MAGVKQAKGAPQTGPSHQELQLRFHHVVLDGSGVGWGIPLPERQLKGKESREINVSAGD